MDSLFSTTVATVLILSLAPQADSFLLHTNAPTFGAMNREGRPSTWQLHFEPIQVSENVREGCILRDLPTPCLLLEMSLAESAAGDIGLDTALRRIRDGDINFDGSVFVHTTVIDTSERDQITKTLGSGKSSIICKIDTTPDQIPGGAYLGIGLANHHVGGYYWARGMGMGASLPAHGIEFGSSSSSSSSISNDTANNGSQSGQLFWRKRGPGSDARETTEESSNSNDGKRSEWADFLSVGDRVELVPNNATAVLRNSPYQVLIGVRRQGRPLGADPIVEQIWQRYDGGWIPKG